MPTATKQVFTGIDYIRLTATDHKPLAAWRDIVLPEFVREERAGRKPHNRWILGYYGRVGEHCFVGENDEGCMIQLSGAMAWQRWYDAGNHSPRCTRIDIQVTWPYEGQPGEYIREMYQVAQLAPKREGKQLTLQLTDTPKGAKMLTAGSRQSELYGRMYDKFEESKMPEYKSCVRWEVECKADTARDVNAHLRENRNEPYAVRAMVMDYWARRGMTPFWETFEAMEMVPPVKRSKTDETKIAWLATQVFPTVVTLTEHGKLAQAIRAVFGQGLTDAQVQGIIDLLSDDVGS